MTLLSHPAGSSPQAIYHTLNKCSVDVTRKVLVAEAWVPASARPRVQEALRAVADSTSQVRQWWRLGSLHACLSACLLPPPPSLHAHVGLLHVPQTLLLPGTGCACYRSPVCLSAARSPQLARWLLPRPRAC